MRVNGCNNLNVSFVLWRKNHPRYTGMIWNGLAFPRDLTCVPLDEVEGLHGFLVTRYYSRDDIVIMFVAAPASSSISRFFALVPASFSPCVANATVNGSSQKIGLRFTFEWKIRVLVIGIFEFNLVSRANGQFCSSSQDCECVLSRFFGDSLNQSSHIIDQPFRSS